MDGSKVAAGGTAGAGLAAAVVYIAGRFGANLTSEDGALVAVAAITVFAFVAHNGIRGSLRLIWSGPDKPAPAAPETPAETPAP